MKGVLSMLFISKLKRKRKESVGSNKDNKSNESNCPSPTPLNLQQLRYVVYYGFFAQC